MSTAVPNPRHATLEDLRAEIDAIDESLHDLLMRRAGLAAAIARLKNGKKGADAATFFRPAREAAVLRRLLSRHEGPFPTASLVQIWREMMGALLRLQGPFAVAVGVDAPDGAPLKELVRDHFGTGTRIRALLSSVGAVRAVAVGRATVAVVPYPAPERRIPRHSWWLSLAQRGAPRVVAALPALARRYDPAALAVAKTVPEPTGRDRSLAVLRAREVLSSQRIAGYLNRSGIDGRVCDRASAGRAVLLEIEGFVEPDSDVLDGMRAEFGLGAEALTVIGTFPVPPIFDGAAT
ncbi:MAG TPA: chorismate mutase [Alphaproteobacteria bacterium]|nr:chorismate mutase [Alphaproteobacteria bacterium]